jgi:hypothetical protein
MLVPVPWQPALYVHEDLLKKLVQVQARMGRPPMLYGDASGWRSYEMQLEKWRKFLAGGNPASNPDSGPRTHMRGVAADLADYSPAMQRALVAVGLERDPAEAWHWQLKTWRSYPIIPTMPKPDLKDDDVKLIRRTGSATDEWSLFHPTLKGVTELERGYITTRDEATARGWARTWADGFGNEKSEARDVYVELQAAARVTFAAYERSLPVAGGVDPQEIAEAVSEELADDFSKIPTAAENGAAARKAIVA